jgi:uncharacterized delta-60 repeat protein
MKGMFRMKDTASPDGSSTTTARKPSVAGLLLRITLAAVLALSLLLAARPAQAEEGTGQKQARDAAEQTQAEEGAEQGQADGTAGEQVPTDDAAGKQGQAEEAIAGQEQSEESAAEEAATKEDAAAQEQAETPGVPDDSAVEPEGDDESQEPAATEQLSPLATPEEEPAQQVDPSATPEEDTSESPLELAPLATTGTQSRWAKSYGGNARDTFSSVALTPDGGFVVVGNSQSSNGDFPATKGAYDAIIAKFNANGNKVWAKNYGGSDLDSFSSVTLTPDGGFVAVGVSYSTNGDFPATKGYNDAIIVKFNASGNKVWAKSYGGNGDDEFNSVTPTTDGGFVVVGNSRSINGDFPATKGDYDAIIAKFNANGNKVWAKSYGGSDTDDFSSVTSTTDGGFVAVGYSYSKNGDFPAAWSGGDALIAKFNASGNKVWAKNYGGIYQDFFNSVTSTTDGGFVAVGSSKSPNGDFLATDGGFDAIIAKFNASGNKVWAKSYGGSSNDSFSSVTPASDGGFVAVGSTTSTNGDFPTTKGGGGVIAKFNASGNKVWAKTYGGSYGASLDSVTPASDGGFVAVGTQSTADINFNDALIVKFNSQGQLPASTFTGWKKQGSHWYYYKSGTKQKNTALSIKGAVYSFSKTGAMMTGWAKIKGVWRYHASTGAATKGWKKIGNNWYYFKQKGAGMLTGAHKISGAWYVFAKGDSGRMLTGWQKVGKSWYYLRGGSDGRAYRGWVQSGSKWYYFNPKTAKMATGWKKISGRYYYLSGANDGHMVTGTKTIKGVKYRFNASGALVSPKAPKK